MDNNDLTGKVLTKEQIDSAEFGIPDERKTQIERDSKRKMDLMQQEYWRLRNDKQEFMKCPYCGKLNFVDEVLCCELFSKAFDVIIDRQYQIDLAAQMVRNCHSVGLVN